MSLLTEGVDRMRAAATATGEGLTAASTMFQGKLRSARDTLGDASQQAFDKTRETAAAADDYVRDNRWIVFGVAIAAGVLIGFLAARR